MSKREDSRLPRGNGGAGRRLRPDGLLVAALALALTMRVWGLTWGLPSATHYFSYHPDESVVLETASVTMNVFAGRLLPHFYNYGSLQLYLVCFWNTLGALLGFVDIGPRPFEQWYPDWARMYLLGRCLTVGMGVGTVGAVFAIGARLWGRRAGLLAALTLAIMPLHAQHSHFLTVDVPATFWGCLALLWAARAVTGDPPVRAVVWGGVFAGLAAATKYNMALALLPVLWACGMTSRPVPKRLALAGLAVLAFAGAFLVGCPGAVLEPQAFRAGLTLEAAHVQNAQDPTFRDTGSGFVYLVTHNLSAGLGLPLLLLALASVGYALWRRERGDGLLAAFALLYYVLISLAAVRYARYTIPLLPILALWTGRMLADGSRLPRPLPRRAAVWAGGLALLLTGLWCVRLVSFLAGPDVRDRALTELKGQTVGFAVQPWFGEPPLSPYFSMPQPGGWQGVVSPENAARIVYTGRDWDLDLLSRRKPPVIVLSEYDYRDAVRLKDPDALRFLAMLKQEYRRQKILEGSTTDFGRGVRWEVGMPTRGWPHDMLYPCPIISIYQRRP